ncbi:MAG: (d)CMP kinase [Bergeyella sp.]|nr:(d)CMP kinase [Bergeyella sp.]
MKKKDKTKNNTQKPNIAIDGYSSTGKSSLSKAVAKKLGLIPIDTGALYRGITYYALRHCFDTKQIDFSCLYKALPNISLGFRKSQTGLALFLQGKNISKEIRFPEVSDHVSLVAKEEIIRAFLLKTQRNMASVGGVIMDGRDIGTTVLPDADYKFFLTASIEERAKRRFLELLHSGIKADFSKVKENLIARDKMDSERLVAPLKKAEEAIEIDNTVLTEKETVDIILSHIK